MVGRRILPDPWLNDSFNTLSIDVKDITISVQWPNFDVNCQDLRRPISPTFKDLILIETLTLRKKCPYSELFSPNAENTDQNNSDTFQAA